MSINHDLEVHVDKQGLNFQDSFLAQLKRMNDHWQHQTNMLVARNPIIKTVAGSNVIVGAGGTAFAGTVEVSEHPSRGRIWNILKAVVASADGHTAPGGAPTADLYAGTLIDPNNNPVISSLIQGNVVIPGVTFWSRGVEWCTAGESIFALVYGGTASTPFNVNISFRVADYASEAVEGVHT